MAFYELRQYKVLPGKMDEWVRIMEQEIIPFQVSKGMVICGSFRGETDNSVYVWLRRFEAKPSAKRNTRRSTKATTGRMRSRRAFRTASIAPRWS
jgi:hypothetical protein